jgi:hypothetical protein
MLEDLTSRGVHFDPHTTRVFLDRAMSIVNLNNIAVLQPTKPTRATSTAKLRRNASGRGRPLQHCPLGVSADLAALAMVFHVPAHGQVERTIVTDQTQEEALNPDSDDDRASLGELAQTPTFTIDGTPDGPGKRAPDGSGKTRKTPLAASARTAQKHDASSGGRV